MSHRSHLSKPVKLEEVRGVWELKRGLQKALGFLQALTDGVVLSVTGGEERDHTQKQGRSGLLKRIQSS